MSPVKVRGTFWAALKASNWPNIQGSSRASQVTFEVVSEHRKDPARVCVGISSAISIRFGTITYITPHVSSTERAFIFHPKPFISLLQRSNLQTVW